MNKEFWKSKTLWGFGVAGLIAIAQIFGITYSDAIVTQLVQVLSAFLGVFGLRSAIE